MRKYMKANSEYVSISVVVISILGCAFISPIFAPAALLALVIIGIMG